MKQYLKRNGVASKIKVYEDIDPKLAIDAIHNAGGKAIIAHPFKEVKNLESELKTLREKGLDGIEMQPNFGMKNLPFLQYATRHNMLVTYGSDYHGGSMSARHLLGRVQNNAIDIAPYLRN
jgi:predicted metal-dependent phosphoesterase TrpH